MLDVSVSFQNNNFCLAGRFFGGRNWAVGIERQLNLEEVLGHAVGDLNEVVEHVYCTFAVHQVDGRQLFELLLRVEAKALLLVNCQE